MESVENIRKALNIKLGAVGVEFTDESRLARWTQSDMQYVMAY
jgi:hypothetical protein